MIDLNKKGYPNRALNILNELKGMEIGEAQEMLDWCRDHLLRQPVSGWSICVTDDKKRCTFKADSQCQDKDLCNRAENQKARHSDMTGNRSGWHGKFYTNNPAEMAYRILLLLEEAKVPRMCVDEILTALKSILGFQEVTHTRRNEESPSFPK